MDEFDPEVMPEKIAGFGRVKWRTKAVDAYDARTREDPWVVGFSMQEIFDADPGGVCGKLGWRWRGRLRRWDTGIVDGMNVKGAVVTRI